MAGLAIILAATFRHGDPAVMEDTPLSCIVCGSQGLTDVILNLLLFIPFGFGLGLARIRVGTAVGIGALLSLSVETAQYSMLVGRSASLSDVIFNTAGTSIGTLAGRYWLLLLLPPPRAAARLCAAAVTGAGLLLAASAWALVPAFPPPPYAVNQITRDPGAIRPFEGTVIRSAIDGRSHPPPARVHALDPSEGRVLDAGEIELEADVHAMYPPGMLRPLVLASATDSSEILLMGQRRESLVLRSRTRGSALRLVRPTFALDGAFPALQEIPPGDDPSRGPLVRIRAAHQGAAVQLASEWTGGRQARSVDRTPLLGWTMLAPFGIAYGRWGAAITAGWSLLLILPGAYWAGRARLGYSWAPLLQFLAILGILVMCARLWPVAMPSGEALAVVLLASWGGVLLGWWSCARVASPGGHRQLTSP